MKLRTAVLTAALGASVLTTVPAMVGAASFAYACDNQTSTCDEPPADDPPPDDPGIPTDPGGGNPGDPGNPIQLDPVTVTGHPDPLPEPPPPPPPEQFPTDPPGSRVVKEIEGADRTTRQASQCFRNDSSAPFTVSTGISYTQGVETSGNVSASAASILSVEFGFQVNSSVTSTFTYSAVVPPGGSFAVYVTYQTNLYLVYADNGPEEVQATVPVETTAGPC